MLRLAPPSPLPCPFDAQFGTTKPLSLPFDMANRVILSQLIAKQDAQTLVFQQIAPFPLLSR
jgi:hypothetical protein